jgi:hypothetical protein
MHHRQWRWPRTYHGFHREKLAASNAAKPQKNWSREDAYAVLGWSPCKWILLGLMHGSMIMRTLLCVAILAAMLPSGVDAAGMASNANFIVLVPIKPSPENAEKYAKLVLERAQQFRDSISMEWLGSHLPDGDGRTRIAVEFTNKQNSGFTWAKDDPQRQFHTVYLNTSPTNAAGAVLNHEIAHTVLATKYPHPNRLPPWVEEGIASRYDDATLIAVRQQEVRSWFRMGRMPRLVALMNLESMSSFDDMNYAAAESLVSFLVTRGDKRRVVEFAEYGQRAGWDEALRVYYRIADVQQLQAEWQLWLLNVN